MSFAERRESVGTRHPAGERDASPLRTRAKQREREKVCHVCNELTKTPSMSTGAVIIDHFVTGCECYQLTAAA